MVFDPLFLVGFHFFHTFRIYEVSSSIFWTIIIECSALRKKVRLTVLKFNDNDAQHVYTIAAKMLCNCFGMQCKNAFV